MKRLVIASLAALLGLSASAQAGGLCCGCAHCQQPGPTCNLPDKCPCDNPLRFGAVFGAQHTQQLLQDLCSCDACVRLKAAKKLGCTLHADFCSCPDVLTSLAHAVMCDQCWVVRRAAVWAIARQGARTEYGVLVLYIASRLDHHFLVRDAAIDALSALLICRRDYYTCLFEQADVLIKKLRPQYNPTKGECVHVLDGFCAEHGIVPGAISSHAAVTVPGGTTVVSESPLPAGAVVVNPALVPVVPNRTGSTATMITPPGRVIGIPTSTVIAK
jgi:hypothetical protein